MRKLKLSKIHKEPILNPKGVPTGKFRWMRTYWNTVRKSFETHESFSLGKRHAE